LALLGFFTLCLSSEVLSEYREVLSRPKFARQSERIQAILEMLEAIAERVIPQDRLTLASDDDDNRLLECAMAAHADWLVTGNRKHFPDRIGDTRILAPHEFLTELGF
jgi:putative PIN family toxin of toxin-antitoxin system